MSWSEISGTPLLAGLYYVPVDDNPPPSLHVLNPIVGIVLAQLPANVLQEMTNLLSTPFDQLVQQAWAGAKPAGESVFAQMIEQGDSNAYDVSVNFPDSGTLYALTENGLPPYLQALLPTGQSGNLLALRYELSGGTGSFKERNDTIFGSWSDARIDITYDLAIEIEIAVPTDPKVPLQTKTTGYVTNIHGGPGNLIATVGYAFIEGASWLTGMTVNTSYPDQSGSMNTSALFPQLSQLSTALVMARPLGFTQLAPRINPNPPSPQPTGNTVELDLTHPADPGPLVSNALGLRATSLSPPTLDVSVPVVVAGDTLSVIGNAFPPPQATALTITWSDTTSGTVVESQIRWGSTSGLGTPPAQEQPTITLQRVGHDNTYGFTNLAPGTVYAFLVRDLDCEAFVATGWSAPVYPPLSGPQPWDGAWTYIETQASNDLSLVLTHKDTFLGAATPSAGGSFSVPVTIPPDVPAGTYQILAEMGGQVVAQATIKVLAHGTKAPPILQTLDSLTRIPFAGQTPITAGNPILLHGSNFGPGTVHLWVDTVGQNDLGTGIVRADGTFDASPVWPFLLGPHTVIAVEGNRHATAPVYGEALH
jgi:hypothetical protein